MSSRPVSDDEAKRLEDAGRGDPRDPANEHVIGLDGIAVVVNGANPVSTLSLAELGKIFSGETVSWGTGEPIAVYARDARSGTFEAFRGAVLAERPLATSAKRFAGNRELADAVQADPHGIGFVPMTAIRTLKVVSISESGTSARMPTVFTVATEDYPLTRRLYMYAPTPRLHAATEAFLKFVLSAEGQGVVAREGFVDMSAKTETAAACTGCSERYVAATKDARRLSFDFHFRSGGTELDSRGKQDLPRLVSYLSEHRTARPALLGFADSNGPADTNVQVSSARARSVEQALVPFGVKVEQVTGFGEEMPIASNETPAGRERNRRVEVWVRDGTSAAPPNR
jgi:phosphate transport system substrate-binding protein